MYLFQTTNKYIFKSQNLFTKTKTNFEALGSSQASILSHFDCPRASLLTDVKSYKWRARGTVSTRVLLVNSVILYYIISKKKIRLMIYLFQANEKNKPIEI